MRGLLRRYRRRLSPATRPMAVQARLPWYVRAAAGFFGVAASFAAGMWIYDAMLRPSGAMRDFVEDRAALTERVAVLEREQVRLRALADSNDSRLQVERTTHEQLARQLKSLEEENARLKEELSQFDAVFSGGPEGRLGIHRFRVEASGVPGEYRFRLLLTAGGGRDTKDFVGSVQLVVNATRGGSPVVLTFPEGNRNNEEIYRLNFKRVKRVEGIFRVEPSITIRTVQVRVLEQGMSAPRASENFTMS